MPFFRLIPLAAAMMLIGGPLHAQADDAPPAKPPVPAPSAMDAQLFYEVLLGELSARGQDPGTGYALLLDAARRANDATLYQRAIEVALQSRSGEAALQAARQWKAAQPDSRDANRYVLQILIVLNRIADTVEPLQTELARTPDNVKPQALAAIVPLYARVGDREQVAVTIEKALAPELTSPVSGAQAWTVVGQLRRLAGQNTQALEAARRGLALQPDAESPVLLALDLMDARFPPAEALVLEYLSSHESPELRLIYARELIEHQRPREAAQQLNRLTRSRPDLSDAWLLYGTLLAQHHQPDQARPALQRYVDQVQPLPASEARTQGLTQAYLTLAQLAEKRKDYATAHAMLDQVPNAQESAPAQIRRASVLAAQGQLAQARALLQQLPQGTAAQARQKVIAEARLLRDQRQHGAAYALLQTALNQSPDDTDLLYEQALTAEKLGQPDVMEQLLRAIIERQPDNQAAYNALGYALADRGVRLEEARQLIAKALELAPGDPFITDSLGWLEFRAQNLVEALRLLDQAFKAQPDPEIAAHLGEVLWATGQKARAMQIWREGLGMSADNETLQETLRRLQVKP